MMRKKGHCVACWLGTNDEIETWEGGAGSIGIVTLGSLVKKGLKEARKHARGV